MASKTGWIVTTSEQRPIADIVKDLTHAGFAVTTVMDEIGCISGNAEPGVVGKLRAIRGVIDISTDTSIDVGPPDAPIS
jgi:hypothetical protein